MHTNRLFTSITVIIVLLLTGSIAGPALAQNTPRAFLGISFEETGNGVIIREVVAGSGAEAAGLQVNDIITALDGEAVTAEAPLGPMILAHQPGDTIVLTIERDGEIIELEATLGVHPDDERLLAGGSSAMMAHFLSFGGATFQLNSAHWLVTEIEAGSPAEAAGLAEADVVTALNGSALTDVDTGIIATLVRQGEPLRLSIERDGETLEVVPELEADADVRYFSAEAVGPVPVPPPPVTEPEEARPVEPVAPAEPEEEPRGFLGVIFVSLSPEIIEAMAEDPELPFAIPGVEEGGLILDVLPETPAAQAGLQIGDVVISVEGDRVDEERTLADRVYPYEAGDTVTMEVVRGEEAFEITVTLVIRPPEADVLFAPEDLARVFGPFVIYLPPERIGDLLERLPTFGGMLGQYSKDGALVIPGNQAVDLFERFPDLRGILAELDAQVVSPSVMPMFMEPNFDWDTFLEENPDFLEMMRRLFEDYDPQELHEMFPNFPWFGDSDPFHQDLEPMESEDDTIPA
jgi:S1-C subfamily serine protease